MASQSPQRSRKAAQSQQQQQQQQERQPIPGAGANQTGAMGASSSGGIQLNGRREPSPSPSLKERQRYARTQSMPIVAPLSQLQQSSTQPPQKTQTHQRHPSSPSQESVFKNGPTYKDIGVQDDDSELPHLHPPLHPPLVQSHSFPLPPPAQQQSRYQPQPTRAHPPQFITRLQDESDGWHMTPELIHEIERADMQQQAMQQPPPAPGTVGVAYAGGAGGGTYGRYAANSPQKTSADKTRDVEGGTADSAGRKQSANPLPRSARGSSRPLTPEARTGSPAYYAQNQASTPPALRRGTTGSPTVPVMYANAPSPRPLKNRTPDRSLPVQEEPDEHENGHNAQSNGGLGLQRGRVSPTPSSDLNPTNDLRTSPHAVKDQEATLIDIGSGTGDVRRGDRQQQQVAKKLSDEDDADLSYTPRSPSAALPEAGKGLPQGNRNIHEVLDTHDSKAKEMSEFNAAAFEHTMKKLQADAAERGGQRQNQPPLSSRNDSRQSWYANWLPDYYQAAFADDREQFYDEMAYFQQHYMQTPVSTNSRPNAPVPPTPRSQNGARSPQPRAPLEPMPRTLVPPFSPAPPGGTPYPYPFSHLRRGYAYPTRVSRFPTPATAGGAAFEPSLEEQLELQLQMYALNNGGGAISDSTLSPSSTPYPGMGRGYHPFSAFLAQTRNRTAFHGGDVEGDVDGHLMNVSRQSSPSHMPVPLPVPNFRGRGLKKRSRFTVRNGGVNGRPRVNPPPRVESTQPKDTSPEPSSGEETAGEKFDSQLPRNEEWVDGNSTPNGAHQADDDIGEWEDEESEDEESYLDLEYHPSYISNVDRRRKKWEQKWNDLAAAFRALDRYTDTTMVLMAAPSHSNSLHSLSSRAIRRDASLLHHPAMSSLRESFGQVASQRRISRARQVSLLERLYAYTSDSENGSPTTIGSSREDDLKRALNAALASLTAMKQMYDVREARWAEESKRNAEEREGVEMLLRQTFGGMIQPGSAGQIAPASNGAV